MSECDITSCYDGVQDISKVQWHSFFFSLFSLALSELTVALGRMDIDWDTEGHTDVRTK